MREGLSRTRRPSFFSIYVYLAPEEHTSNPLENQAVTSRPFCERLRLLGALIAAACRHAGPTL